MLCRGQDQAILRIIGLVVSGLIGLAAFAVSAAIRIRGLAAFGIRAAKVPRPLAGAGLGVAAYVVGRSCAARGVHSVKPSVRRRASTVSARALLGA